MKSLITKVAAGSALLWGLALAAPLAHAAAPQWNVTGNYVINMNYLGVDHLHNVALTQDGSGNVTGNGTSTPYAWAITSGKVEGNTLSFNADYSTTSDAVTPQTTLHATGTIASNGTIAGTWSDNYQGGSRAGTWATVSGTSTQIIRTLTYTAGTHGSVTGSTSQMIVNGGNGTAVTAVADGGYHFVNWSDASTTNPRTDMSVTANLSVMANFALNSTTTHTLQYAAGSHGTVTGSTTQIVNDGASGSAVTAVADSGYHFTMWSDSSTANPRTDTNVTVDKAVTAMFALNGTGGQGTTTGDKNLCKKGGWMGFLNWFGFHFKNQGQCVKAANHGTLNATTTVQTHVEVNKHGNENSQGNNNSQGKSNGKGKGKGHNDD